jgi:hypothetical protein
MANEVKGGVNVTTGVEEDDLNVKSFLRAKNVAGLSFQNNGGTPCISLGGGGGVNATMHGNTLFTYAAANRLAYLNGAKVLTNTDLVSWIAGTTDQIVVTDDGDGSITLSLVPIYAEICVADGSTAQSIPTGTTYTKSTAFTINGPSSNCTADAANDKITVTKTGVYRVTGSFSGSAGTANVIFRCAAFLDGVEQDCAHFKHKYATANDADTASFTGFVDVTSVPADLDVRFRHDNIGSVNLTLEYANFNVQYIGNT